MRVTLQGYLVGMVSGVRASDPRSSVLAPEFNKKHLKMDEAHTGRNVVNKDQDNRFKTLNDKKSSSFVSENSTKRQLYGELNQIKRKLTLFNETTKTT